VTRDIYAVSARVEHGNSGGPLLSPTGQVVGTVFAKSVSDDGTGYVLTLDETRPVVEEGVRATAAVGTGSCAA
jgi:S1-C subfamily serine protease